MTDVTESRAVNLEINGKLKLFDIDNPELPAWIEEHALGSGGYPYDDKMDKDKYEKQLEKLQIGFVPWARLKHNEKDFVALGIVREEVNHAGTFDAAGAGFFRG